jgi:hypothetical protein
MRKFHGPTMNTAEHIKTQRLCRIIPNNRFIDTLASIREPNFSPQHERDRRHARARLVRSDDRIYLRTAIRQRHRRTIPKQVTLPHQRRPRVCRRQYKRPYTCIRQVIGPGTRMHNPIFPRGRRFPA